MTISWDVIFVLLPPQGFVQLSTFLYSPHSGGGTSVDQERAVDRSTTGREPLLQESATTPLQMVDSEPQKVHVVSSYLCFFSSLYYYKLLIYIIINNIYMYIHRIELL